MWSDRIWFLTASLSAIGVCISLYVARYINFRPAHEYIKDVPNTRTTDILQMCLRTVCVFVFILVGLLIIYLLYKLYEVCRYYPSYAGDVTLSVLVGAAFGTFVTRFVWALFGPSFGTTEAVLGVAVFVLLSVGYSLPVYYRHLWLLLQSSGIGISSVKLPVAEITFADRSRQVVGVGTHVDDKVGSSGVPRPSDPSPGLDFLAADVDYDAGFPRRDKEYIAFFKGSEDDTKANRYIDNATKMLEPMRDLGRCLHSYVTLVPDAQLLSIDLKPVLEDLFKIQASARRSLLGTRFSLDGHGADIGENWSEWVKLREDIADIMDELSKNFGHPITNNVTQSATNAPPASDAIKQNEITGYCESRRVKEFIHPQNVKPNEYVSPLQPYTAIALASLLQAHGSTDEAIDVVAKWLDTWRCARGDKQRSSVEPEEAGLEEAEGCDFGPVKEALDLPEWFRFRAEFQMNVLLFQYVGDLNFVYHDFLREHKDAFEKFAEAGKNPISIPAVLRRCEKAKDASSLDQRPVAIRVLQLRLDDEKSFLEAERNFLYDKEIPDLESLYNEGVQLTKFTPDCIEPREEFSNFRENFWTQAIAEYKISSGLLGLAVANRMSRIAASGYERRRAAEIRKESEDNLRKGLRILKPFRDGFQQQLRQALWSDRLFRSFPNEQSYSLAAKAIDELNSSEP